MSLALLVGALAAVAVGPSAPPRLAAQAVSCPPGVGDRAGAAAMARLCGGRVEVTGAIDETSQTFANADGTFTWESSVRPRFARKADGAWTKADATLVANADGTISPRAATFPMVFSGGGASAPLIRADRQGGQLSMSWKGSLPKPVLDGNVATYAEILPGVDLRVVAGVDGFSEHVVVKSRAAAAPAALRRLRLGLAASGLAVRRDASGSIDAVNPAGDVVFSAGTPLMWDASDVPARARLLAAGKVNEAGDVVPRTASVGIALDGGDLLLTPDAAMLDDASVVYPVVIDPTVVGARNHWTELSKSSPTTSYFDAPDGTFGTTDSTNGLARVGLSDWQSPVFTMRPVFEMDTSGVVGAGKVTAASFRLAQRWSGVKCTDTPGPSAVGLYQTPPITSATNWNTSWNTTGTGWTTLLGSNSDAHRTDMTGATCGPNDVVFDLTGSLTTLSLGCCGTLTLGLKGDESAHTSWKRYLNDAANSPTLSITYDAKPTITSTSTAPATTCVTGAGRPVLATGIPTLSAAVSDSESQPMSAKFEWWAVGGSAAIGSTTVANVASGTTASAQIPSGQLAGGGAYQWRVTVSDGSTPVVSPWCEFSTMILDPQAPGCPAALAPGDFNGDGVRDRVLGDPQATVGTQATAGAIYLVDGATGARRTLQEGLDGVPGTPEAGDQFGRALMVFDANRDGCADLAIGAPFEDYNGVADSGAVYLLYGSPLGLGKGPAAMTIGQGLALPGGRGAVPDAPEAGDWFGAALAGGVTAANEPYLVIGAPGEDVGGVLDAGTVHYLRGSVDVKFDGSSPEGAERDDRSGASVAASPYQVAIGSPGEAAGPGSEFSGAVCVLNHNSGGTPPAVIRCLRQGDDTYSSEAPERNDQFAQSIAMVAYRPVGAASGVADSLLVVGVPGEDLGSADDAGIVQEYLITATGVSHLGTVGGGTPGVGEADESGDYFGQQVAVVNRDPAAVASASTVLVAVGAPGEDRGSTVDSGVVRVFAGGTNVLTGSVLVERVSGALPGSPVAQELIGGWLASDGTNLLVSSPYGTRAAYVLPWANLAAGNGTPVTTYAPGVGGLPSTVYAFATTAG
ncbi:integrin alpha [Hamadaea tsunoensis]|uniref:integrin alpha n=1 Tax=Hamadaea tsunoensis TaxID=53368 RepID=UPI00068691C9|nr:integrin alpha [Hamadaea tsunoensis]